MQGSLADAEARKNFSQQVVRRKFARDGTQRLLGEAQFLGEEFPASLLCQSLGEMLFGFRQRAQMAFAGHEQGLAGTLPASRA